MCQVTTTVLHAGEAQKRGKFPTASDMSDITSGCCSFGDFRTYAKTIKIIF